MNKAMLFAVAMSLALLSAAGGYYFYRQQHAPEALMISEAQASPLVTDTDVIGLSRPDFSLNNVDGQLRHINEWDGQVVALNFWATWCPPCLKEIPEFIHLQDKYADQGLQFIGIALQEPEPVKAFMQEYGMNYPVLAGELEVIKLAKSYGNSIGALPYTVIIDRQGRIAFVKPGPLSGEQAEEVILGLL